LQDKKKSKVASSMAGQNVTHYRIENQTYVPRVVSEQGPIKMDPNEED